MAGKKSWLTQVEFENDYGVDIGILIDMHLLGARIAEVNIGTVINKMKAWQALGKMSKEVSRAILRRASKLPTMNLETLEDISVVSEELDNAINETKQSLKKMVVFDMDNTILHWSFIRTAAKHFNFEQDLAEIVAANYNPFVRTKKIAYLLKSKSLGDLVSVLDSIPVVEDFGEVVKELKTRGYVTGIISDSYTHMTNHLKTKYGLDFSVANELEFDKGVCTGDVKIPFYFLRDKMSVSDSDYCKSNILLKKAQEYSIDVRNVIAIGDGENDMASIKLAGIGISFCSNYEYLDMVADMVIKERKFRRMLDVA